MAGMLLPFSGEFAYASWAACGIGSTVTLEDVSEMTMDFGCLRNVTLHKATLKALDPSKATVELEIRGAVNGAALDSRHTAEYLARPEPEAVAGEESYSSEDGSENASVTMMSYADIFKDALSTEGTEVLDVAGQTLSCRWIERAAALHGQDFRMKLWLSERVPGGIVKSEARMGTGHVTKTTVTSFEKK